MINFASVALTLAVILNTKNVMASSREIFKADFDRIASLSDYQSCHKGPYESFLLKHVPLRCDEALEIGCGTGAFSRLLAERARSVSAIDFSPEMIRLATARSSAFANIEFLRADITETEFPRAQFDCIVSIATLHHLPIRATLEKLKAALSPNGILIVHDLFQSDGLFDLAASALAHSVWVGRQFINFGRLRPPRAVREAWKEHGRHDTYLTLKEVRKLRNDLLPNAVVKRHLLWRYSLIWRKPEG